MAIQTELTIRDFCLPIALTVNEPVSPSKWLATGMPEDILCYRPYA